MKIREKKGEGIFIACPAEFIAGVDKKSQDLKGRDLKGKKCRN